MPGPRPAAQTGRVLDLDTGTRAGSTPRRWRIALLVAAVVLLFAYVLTHRVTDLGTDAGAAPPPEDRAELAGRPGDGPRGLLVLIGGPAARVLDTHTGELTAVPGLNPGQDERSRLRPVPGGVLATLTNDRGSRVLLLRDGTATLLGTAVQVVPTRAGDLAVAAQGNGRTTVRLRAPDGTVRATWGVRGLADPVRDTAGGLLLSRVLRTGSAGVELQLVDPRTGAARRTLGTDRVLLAAGDGLVAHRAADCRLDCPVTVSDAATGKDRVLPAVPGPPAATGAIGPDGDRLALSFPGDPLATGRSRPGFVAVQDLADGRVVTVPGVRTPPAQRADVDWSPEGGVLVIAVWWSDRAAIGLWSPADPGDPPVVLRTRPPGDRFAGIAATDG